ncbi:dienelactone hydrolase family protein [Paenibacillus sepulcri]|uniref:Dienelactone hydrolase family protein n=1 Tax=Paenibacillus sepulcri TaxID=359917 RepID=A0ABS7C4M9_9BACL|nr:dienelactone hydrolase family protein [Paenibacillus sepulcri]
MPVTSHLLRQETPEPVRIGYQLFLPSDYERNTGKKWPLILFLHCIKKRGDDLALLHQYGVARFAEERKDFGFIVATPQCPEHSDWPQQRNALSALLDEIARSHRVDPERVYLTGFSMGGNGTWDLAANVPGRFAAIAPLAGYYQPEDASLLKGIPVWAFHGEKDDVVIPGRTTEMVNAIRSLGGSVRYTAYPELDHQIWEETYGNPELYQWFLEHKR